MELIDTLALWCGRIIFVVMGLAGTAAVVGLASNWAYHRVNDSRTFMKALQHYASDVDSSWWRVLLAGKSIEKG